MSGAISGPENQCPSPNFQFLDFSLLKFPEYTNFPIFGRRGLTPPHRVKSITMATFTPEEIEIMQSRGNQYCKNVWLGLYDSEIPTSDEQQIKDFMTAKYEKKRYYVDPSSIATHSVVHFANGSRTPSSLSSTSSSSHNSPSSHNLSDSSTKLLNTVVRTQTQQQSSSLSSSKTSNSVTSNGSSQLFAANFESPLTSSSSQSSSIVDPFGSCGMDTSASSETSFANFDNNPAFDACQSAVRIAGGNGFCNGYNVDSSLFTGFSVHWGLPTGSSHKPTLKTLPLAFSRWSIATDNGSNLNKNKTESNNVPSEDKYAALKDLDFQMKNQMMEKQQEELKQKLVTNGDWGTNSNGFNWTSLFANRSGFSSEPGTPFNPFSHEITSWKANANVTVNPFSSETKDPWSNSVNWPSSKTQCQQNAPNGWIADANTFDANSARGSYFDCSGKGAWKKVFENCF
ncbi:hypothetical protein V9T40_011781 [Parthenolecanium corni]|uniref:Arf-GAP domain-containing protein n=1 Tax=Parthenolecanium corni TaxID=536013 RepID=A0AAN9T6N9_9HEMI